MRPIIAGAVFGPLAIVLLSVATAMLSPPDVQRNRWDHLSFYPIGSRRPPFDLSMAPSEVIDQFEQAQWRTLQRFCIHFSGAPTLSLRLEPASCVAAIEFSGFDLVDDDNQPFGGAYLQVRP